MMRAFTEKCLRADFCFSLNVNVTVDIYMNSTSQETIVRIFLQEWIDLNIFRIMKIESTSKAVLFETNYRYCFFLNSFSMYF